MNTPEGPSIILIRQRGSTFYIKVQQKQKKHSPAPGFCRKDLEQIEGNAIGSKTVSARLEPRRRRGRTTWCGEIAMAALASQGHRAEPVYCLPYGASAGRKYFGRRSTGRVADEEEVAGRRPLPSRQDEHSRRHRQSSSVDEDMLDSNRPIKGRLPLYSLSPSP